MLDDIKTLVGIDLADTTQDAKINLIMNGVKARLKVLLGGIEPPETLNYIVVDVSIIRFNRIGSEGMASHTVEGESQSFIDSDFNGFADDIQEFLATQTESATGKVRFL